MDAPTLADLNVYRHELTDEQRAAIHRLLHAYKHTVLKEFVATASRRSRYGAIRLYNLDHIVDEMTEVRTNGF